MSPVCVMGRRVLITLLGRGDASGLLIRLTWRGRDSRVPFAADSGD